MPGRHEMGDMWLCYFWHASSSQHTSKPATCLGRQTGCGMAWRQAGWSLGGQGCLAGRHGGGTELAGRQDRDRAGRAATCLYLEAGQAGETFLQPSSTGAPSMSRRKTAVGGHGRQAGGWALWAWWAPAGRTGAAVHQTMGTGGGDLEGSWLSLWENFLLSQKNILTPSNR